LSIGGNLVFDAMLDPEVDRKIRMLMTLGTPFHGSPLFSSDWFKYGLYKSPTLPLTRIDRAIAYHFYFRRNPNLLKDYPWDNCDSAIPNIGHFASLLPFGPKGDLTADTAENKALNAFADSNFDRKKLIAYSGYLLNPYLLPQPARFISSRLMAPLSLIKIEIPSHMGKEHPVLKMLNRHIATVVANKQASTHAKTKFVYGLNDGIAPLSSALFIASKYTYEQPVAQECDIAKIKDVIDVRTARVFRNIDHLSFIDNNRRVFATNSTVHDELNRGAGRRDIFNWMLLDISQCQDGDSRLAKEAACDAVPQGD
jgi:hypothetical protein